MGSFVLWQIYKYGLYVAWNVVCHPSPHQVIWQRVWIEYFAYLLIYASLFCLAFLINNQLSNLLTFTIILLALKQSVVFRDSLSETLILKLFPNIDPLGICWVMFLKFLFVLLTQTPCFRFFTNKKLRVVYQFWNCILLGNQQILWNKPSLFQLICPKDPTTMEWGQVAQNTVFGRH